MNKFLSVFLILTLTLTLLISCTPNENKGEEEDESVGRNPIPHSYNGDDEETFYLIGEVTAICDRIEVNVIEGEYAYGIYWVHVGETDIFDQDGNKIPLEDLEIGDVLEVTYNGQVMMSYPPQIVATKVILK